MSVEWWREKVGELERLAARGTRRALVDLRWRSVAGVAGVAGVGSSWQQTSNSGGAIDEVCLAPANSRGRPGQLADRRAHRCSLSRKTKWSGQHEAARNRSRAAVRRVDV